MHAMLARPTHAAILYCIKTSLALEALTKEEYQECMEFFRKKESISFMMHLGSPETNYKLMKDKINKIIMHRNGPCLQIKAKSLERIAPSCINYMASFLTFNDLMHFIRCTRSIYVACHEPIPIKMLNLLETNDYSKIDVTKYTKIRGCLMVRLDPFINNYGNTGVYFNHITCLRLHGEQQTFSDFRKWNNIYCLIDCSRIQRLSLIKFGSRGISHSNPDFLTGTTFINILSSFRNIKVLYLQTMFIRRDQLTSNQKAFTKQLKHDACLQYVDRLHLSRELSVIIYYPLLATTHLTLKELIYYDGTNIEVPILQYPKLQNIQIAFATTRNTMNIITFTPKLKHLAVYKIDVGRTYDRNDQFQGWENIIKHLVTKQEQLQSIAMQCTDPKSLDDLVRWIGKAAIQQNKRITKSLIISIHCEKSDDDPETTKRHLFYLVNSIKTKPTYDTNVRVYFECHDVTFNNFMRRKHKSEHDNECKICYTKNKTSKLLKCYSCPRIYHAKCIRPMAKQRWYKFVEWHCPSCAPGFQRIPLRYKHNKVKYPHYKEPLLGDLKTFLQNHSDLETDPSPNEHGKQMKLYLHKSENRIKHLVFSIHIDKTTKD